LCISKRRNESKTTKSLRRLSRFHDIWLQW
jgi:hypothetical protein